MVKIRLGLLRTKLVLKLGIILHPLVPAIQQRQADLLVLVQDRVEIHSQSTFHLLKTTEKARKTLLWPYLYLPWLEASAICRYPNVTQTSCLWAWFIHESCFSGILSLGFPLALQDFVLSTFVRPRSRIVHFSLLSGSITAVRGLGRSPFYSSAFLLFGIGDWS